MIIILSGWKTQFEVWKETYAKSNSLTGGSVDINFANLTWYSIEHNRAPGESDAGYSAWEKSQSPRPNAQVFLQRLASWKCLTFI